MKLNQLLLLLLSFTLFTCNIESVDIPDVMIEEEEQTNDGVLVKKIIYNKGTDDEYTETFNYDGNKLISVDYGDGWKNVYTYDSDDNLVKDDWFESNELIASVALEYNSDDKVAMYTETFFEGSGLEDRKYKHIITHNNDNTLTNEVYVSYSSADFELYFVKTINLNGKNITKISDDDGFELIYTHDDKNGAFKNIYAIEVLNFLSENEFGALIYGNTNNITRRLENLIDGGNSDTYDDTYEYTYNEKNYPVTAIFTSEFGRDSGNVTVETLEFIYE